MNGKKIGKRNFTLIEILVVLGIIGILIGILLPAIGSSITQGKVTKVKNEAKQIAFAIEGYMQDYGNFPIIVSSETPIELTANHILLTYLGGDNPRKKNYYANSGTIPNPLNGPYWLVLDFNYDNKLAFSQTYSGVTLNQTTTPINQSVAVFAFGNKTFIKSWE